MVDVFFLEVWLVVVLMFCFIEFGYVWVVLVVFMFVVLVLFFVLW